MSWRPVTLLICFFAVEAARYGDYSGARMPHYGIEYENKDPEPLSGEYSDRSPDALASFDYKYEEEPLGKIDAPNQDDVWQKLTKKRKRPLKPTDDGLEIDENEHISPKFKSNHRIQKHRSRIKDLHNESHRRHYQYGRNRNDDIDDVNNKNEYKLDKDRSRDDNRIDIDNIHFRDTTKKIVRRKPRDRTLSHERLDNDDRRDEPYHFKGKESDDDGEVEYQKERHLQTTLERSRVPFPGMKKVNHKNYQEYDEYYDMKRVNNIKNKLPGLFRQTKASTVKTEPSSMRRFQDITYRRANLPEKDIQINIVADAASTEVPTLTTSLVLTSQTTSIVTESSPTSTDLSLAEKSRLSILKKAQRKDSSRNATLTTKPPVLMQVTKQMQTVVMVEPPKQDLNFRARVVFDDSPERIAKAKSLMRRKLVAGARSIQDLVDNWDEMICDYIDVSLLDNGDNHHTPSHFKIILLSVINCLISKGFV